MSEPKRYEIRRLSDFVKVPPDRRADCLSEFLVALEYADDTLKSTQARMKEVRGIKGWLLRKFGAAILVSRFTWIDDTKRRGTAIINDRVTGQDTGIYHTNDHAVAKPTRVK